MTPTVGIVLVNYNGLADTQQCLQSLTAIDYPRWLPVVVDNASHENPANVIAAEFPGCQVVSRRTNGGWAGGNNNGIRFCLEKDTDYVILLNNDTRVDPALVNRMVIAAESNHGFGILGPVIRDFEPPCDIQTEGCMFNRPDRPEFFQRVHVPLTTGEPAAVRETDIVNGCCMMIAARVFRKIGLIDERFFLIHEETDFCLRARKAGFRCGIVPEALVWHKGSQTFIRSERGTQRYYDARNLLLLLSKHAYLPGPRRGRPASLLQYLKYAYARYELETSAGNADAAGAVLEGVCDALLRRFGPWRDGPRPGIGILKSIFDLRLKLKTSPANVAGPAEAAA